MSRYAHSTVEHHCRTFLRTDSKSSEMSLKLIRLAKGILEFRCSNQHSMYNAKGSYQNKSLLDDTVVLFSMWNWTTRLRARREDSDLYLMLQSVPSHHCFSPPY